MQPAVVAKARKKSPPFIKRMANIVFPTNVRQKGGVKASIRVDDFMLTKEDLATYNKLAKHFLDGETTMIYKSAQDIAQVMPTAVFIEALPRLAKARALTVTFWEHAAATPNYWRKVTGF